MRAEPGNATRLMIHEGRLPRFESIHPTKSAKINRVMKGDGPKVSLPTLGASSSVFMIKLVLLLK